MHEDHSSWAARWNEGRMGWHQDEVNRHLREHLSRLGSGPAILVPMAGKSRDMTWLGEHFERVVGVEFVEAGCRAFFEEQDLPYAVTARAGATHFEGGRVRLIQHDMCTVSPEQVGPIQAVWDRAALIALTPHQRRAYASNLAGLLQAGAVVLLVTLSYDQSKTNGPPFSVPDDEVAALFGQDFEVQQLEGMVPQGLPARFEDLNTHKAVWQMVRR